MRAFLCQRAGGNGGHRKADALRFAAEVGAPARARGGNTGERVGQGIADIPDLPHCSAFGDSPEEALAEVLKAKSAWLEAARAEGKAVPLPTFRPAIYQVA